MIDSVYIALTGLHGYEKGLRVISNNAANLNTPGFKCSSLQFADLYYAGGNASGGETAAYVQYGYGLSTLGTRFNFQQGQFQSTGNDLDLAVDGLGFFVLKDTDGKVHYTRDGQFSFNADGVLVSTTTGEQVMAFDASGALGTISVASLKESAAHATANVSFSGNLSSTATSATVSGVTAIDSLGTSHTLSLKLEPVSGSPDTWNVTVLEGSTTVGTGQIAFINGQPDPAQSKITVTYSPSGAASGSLTLDFSTVTSYDSGSRSTVTMASQDGHTAGSLVRTTFDGDGVLSLSYGNGQTVKGPRLALARFSSSEAVASVGTNEFEATIPGAWQTKPAGDGGFGTVRSGMIESSNVDLSQEFSDLIIMQRGYQASSQIISTANEMLAELFAMRGSK
jgi:flagellar hook protein FlgE